MAKQIAINTDCMEYMRTLPDKAFDLAIVDPPYFSGPERRGYYGCKNSGLRNIRRRKGCGDTWANSI